MIIAQPVQTVRGVVTDRDTKIPLIGVTVIVTGSDPLIGTSTNLDGEFTLTRVPAGRQTLQFINLTGFQEFYGYRYNLRDETIDRHREAIILPNFSYRFEF